MTKYDIIVLRKEILWDVENHSETIMFGSCKRAIAENQRDILASRDLIAMKFLYTIF